MGRKKILGPKNTLLDQNFIASVVAFRLDAHILAGLNIYFVHEKTFISKKVFESFKYPNKSKSNYFGKRLVFGQNI